jgi:hypothetical protein
MLDAKHSRLLFSLAAVGLLTASSIAVAAPPTFSTLALQPPPAPPDPLAPADPMAPPADQPPPPPPPPSLGGLKIEGSGAALRLGFLFQPSYEVASRTFPPNGAPASGATQQHFFVRRIRLMAGLTIGSQLEFFADTDTPNMGRDVNVAPSAGMNIQDAFMTWKPMDEFKLDGGMMLIPFSHNSVQGATTLYAWDYFASSFLQNGGFGNYVGRDIGVQARGLVIGHLEYRLGVFTGARGAPITPMSTNSRAQLRLAARVQYNLFDPETAFFYAGTYAGTKKIVSFGASVDHQDNYTAFGVDAFIDWPLGADVVTAQAAFLHYGDSATAPWIGVPKQNDIIFEAGYRLGALKISPIIRFEDQLFSAPPGGASSSLMRVSAGIAWWPMGHNLNVKLFYSYVKPAVNPFNQLNLQVQLYVF